MEETYAITFRLSIKREVSNVTLWLEVISKNHQNYEEPDRQIKKLKDSRGITKENIRTKNIDISPSKVLQH